MEPVALLLTGGTSSLPFRSALRFVISARAGDTARAGATASPASVGRMKLDMKVLPVQVRRTGRTGSMHGCPSPQTPRTGALFRHLRTNRSAAYNGRIARPEML